MRMPELKSLAREHRLRSYSRMRKAELVALLQNSPPPGQSCASTSPTPPTQTWEPIDDRRPRKPSPQEMDIFEQQEMSKSRPQVKSKLNKWYDWLINYISKPIKDGASRAFKTFKDKIWGCMIGLLVPPNGAQAPQLLSGAQSAQNPNHFSQQSLSKLSVGLTGPIGLMEDPR